MKQFGHETALLKNSGRDHRWKNGGKSNRYQQEKANSVLTLQFTKNVPKCQMAILEMSMDACTFFDMLTKNTKCKVVLVNGICMVFSSNNKIAGFA